LVRIVVAIDPAVSTGEDADETGIIVAGDVLVPAAEPPIELPARPAGPINRVIADHVARLRYPGVFLDESAGETDRLHQVRRPRVKILTLIMLPLPSLPGRPAALEQ
jgi:hypothetical protein